MKKTNNLKIVYYEDELNDDFAGTNIKQKKKLKKSFVTKFMNSWKIVHKNIVIKLLLNINTLAKKQKKMIKKSQKNKNKIKKQGLKVIPFETSVIIIKTLYHNR